MAVVFIVSITAAVAVVIVVLVLRNHRGDYPTGTQRQYVVTFTRSLCFSSTCLLALLCRGPMSAVDIAAGTNVAYELSKFSK